MSGDFIMKHSKENVSLLAAIETCCKHVTDLKLAFNQRFSTLENRMGYITSSYNTIMQRMDTLEKIVKSSTKCQNHRHQCCEELLAKMKEVEQMLKGESLGSHQPGHELEDTGPELSLQSPVVLVHNNKPAQVSASVCLDSTVQVITLNSESDYPDGSWLGDESNPETRVRCPITPPDLLHINTFCQTPEKMAVTLLDYLFPREILAISNLSGKGKHGKKQLDPLMIYGIRCHLLYKFNINERDWYRIKQNMDSKCRTAWRKKVRGLPLGNFKNPSHQENVNQLQEFVAEDGELIVTAGPYNMDEEMETQVIHTAQGDIKILHATPEQLVRFQETHHIQVLSEDLILPVLHEQSQMLDASDEVSSQHVLAIGCHEESLSNDPLSDVNIDVSAVHVHGSQQFVEVQDISMSSSQVLNTDSEGDMSLDEGKSKCIGAAFITVE